MEPLIAFFEKFVSDFSWKRLILFAFLLILAIFGFWAYETFTGHFRSTRMEFAVSHLVKLADPELKKSIAGDRELELAYDKMKIELDSFLNQNQVRLAIPVQAKKAFYSFIPWFLFGLILFAVTERKESGQVIAGMFMFAIPLIALGAFLPTFDKYYWINYLAYPFGSVVLVVIGVLFLQKLRSKTRDLTQTNETS